MLRELAGDPCGAVLLDLGSGGGWFSRRFVNDVPGSRALAVDADTLLHDPYYQDDSSIEFVPERIDDFLNRFGGETSGGERAGADAAIMTDVLEHLLGLKQPCSLFPSAAPGRVSNTSSYRTRGYFRCLSHFRSPPRSTGPMQNIHVNTSGRCRRKPSKASSYAPVYSTVVVRR